MKAILVIAVMSTSGLVAAEDDIDARFLNGLRTRRLFELAEAHCRSELQRDDRSAGNRAELTIELMRTLALRAAHSDRGERAPLWAAARRAGEQLRISDPDNPRWPLVQAQLALTLLAEVELTRQELEVRDDEAGREQALSGLRRCVGELEDLDRQLTLEIPQRRRQPPNQPAALDAEALFALQSHVRRHLVEAYQTRARFYPPGSDDRVLAVNKALQWAVQPLEQLAPTSQLARQIQLDRAICLRLASRWEEAQTALQALRGADTPRSIQRGAAVELARMALDREQPPAALKQLQPWLDDRDPETDLALLDTLIALWKTTPEEADRWRTAAVELSERMRNNHGPYWGRRADQQLARAAGQGATSGDVDILRRQADEHATRHNWSAAAEAYQRAAELAEQASDWPVAFEMAYKSALAARRGGAESFADDVIKLSLRLARAPRAPAAHLQIAKALGRAAADDPAQLPRYAAALEEHLRQWPASPTAHEARWWLGSLRRHQRQWASALEALQAIAADSQFYPEAVADAGACWRQLLGQLQEAGRPLDEGLKRASGYFENVVTGGSGSLPASWTPAQRSAATAAAELWLRFAPQPHARAESLLRRAIDGTPAPPQPWLSQAQVLLIIALAGQPDRLPQAQQLLLQLGAAPEELLSVVQQLDEVAADAAPEMRAPIAQLQLQALEKLQPNGGLTPLQRSRLRAMRAAALGSAGRNRESAAAWAELAQEQPKSGDIQRRYALALSAADDHQAALLQWRRVARGNPARSDGWYEAKHFVALSQLRTGDPRAAAQLLRYVQATTGVSDDWKARYAKLLSAAAAAESASNSNRE